MDKAISISHCVNILRKGINPNILPQAMKIDLELHPAHEEVWWIYTIMHIYLYIYMNIHIYIERYIYIYGNSTDFHTKISVNAFGKKIDSTIYKFCVCIFVFINQSAHSNYFLNFKILCRQQYLTCYEKFEILKLKIILGVFATKNIKMQFLSQLDS